MSADALRNYVSQLLRSCSKMVLIAPFLSHKRWRTSRNCLAYLVSGVQRLDGEVGRSSAEFGSSNSQGLLVAPSKISRAEANVVVDMLYATNEVRQAVVRRPQPLIAKVRERGLL